MRISSIVRWGTEEGSESGSESESDTRNESRSSSTWEFFILMNFLLVSVESSTRLVLSDGLVTADDLRKKNELIRRKKNKNKLRNENFWVRERVSNYLY